MANSSRRYVTTRDLPQNVPVFPLDGTILLPRRELPLNIFEPRYLAMIDAALASDRVVGMIQPVGGDNSEYPALVDVGGLGRITAFSETPDSRYIICLTGICRFRVAREHDVLTAFRQCELAYQDFAADLIGGSGADDVDRARLLEVFASYLEAKELEADWDEVARSDNEALVDTLTMISPFGPREKQALLEAKDLASRAGILVALTEMALASDGDGPDVTLQ